MTDSPELATWLATLLASDENMQLDADTVLDEDEEVVETSPAAKLIWYFPTDDLRDEYIASINTRSEAEVRSVISHMLIPTGAFGHDHLNFEAYIIMRDKSDRTPIETESFERWSQTDYMQRVLGYYGGTSDEFPWQGIKWVLRLLPDHPRNAIHVLEAYFLAERRNLTDNMSFALNDAEAVIRARFIGVPETTHDRITLLRDLGFRDFEHIVANLYEHMGYEVELTPPSGDGGRDIIATRSTAGMQERIFVECKNYENKVRIETVRALLGVVSKEHVNKGVLVTTSGFTRGGHRIESEDRRLELISGPGLVLLLNEHLGWTWPTHIDYFSRPRQLAGPSVHGGTRS